MDFCWIWWEEILHWGFWGGWDRSWELLVSSWSPHGDSLLESEASPEEGRAQRWREAESWLNCWSPWIQLGLIAHCLLIA